MICFATAGRFHPRYASRRAIDMTTTTFDPQANQRLAENGRPQNSISVSRTPADTHFPITRRSGPALVEQRPILDTVPGVGYARCQMGVGACGPVGALMIPAIDSCSASAADIGEVTGEKLMFSLAAKVDDLLRNSREIPSRRYASRRAIDMTMTTFDPQANQRATLASDRCLSAMRPVHDARQ